jgi:hypothetical protein
MDDHGIARLHAISGAVAGGHLRIYSTDPTIEGGLAALGADGALAQPGGDIAGVTVVNGSGSKVDYYATRSVDYGIQLGGTGDAINTATVTIANDAPTAGQPRYVLGPYVDGAHAGDQIPLTSVWCHAPCELASATRDGSPIIRTAPWPSPGGRRAYGRATRAAAPTSSRCSGSQPSGQRTCR